MRRGGFPRNLRRHDRDRDQVSKSATPLLPYADDPPDIHDPNVIDTPPTVPSFGFQLSNLPRGFGSGAPPIA